MVSLKLHRSKQFNEALLRTVRELSKQCSRLELATHSLRNRDRELLEMCKSSLEKGQRQRAEIYANEIAEIRKTLSVINSTKLVLEQTALRLETIKEVCPTLHQLREVFGNVKGTLNLLANVMPLMSPEMDALNETLTEILHVTQPTLPSVEPLVIKNAATEAVIQEAAGIVEEELMRKIPEPPTAAPPVSSAKAAKPMVAVTTGGVEVYENQIDDSPSIANPNFQPPALKNTKSDSLFEELILDYIYRSKGEIELARCAEELGISQNEVLNVLDVLRSKGKIKIEQ